MKILELNKSNKYGEYVCFGSTYSYRAKKGTYYCSFHVIKFGDLILNIDSTINQASIKEDKLGMDFIEKNFEIMGNDK